jgi:O-antigen/teichoic acid export membrane protein
MSSVRRSLFFSITERYFLIALGLASSMLLARLLRPDEIGLYSVSLALIGIAQVLREFGVGNFLIQERNLTEEHIRTALGITLLIGATLFTATWLAVPFITDFYGNPRMASTLRIAATNFLLLPFCTISLSLLRREMRFKELIVINLCTSIIGLSTSVILAYAGFGANSMAVGSVVMNIVTGIGAWLARKERRLLLPSFAQWRSVTGFGARASLTNILTSISMNINDLAVGRILGFGPVAMISRAQGLMNIFHAEIMGAIRNVAYPTFARLHREGGDLESRHVFAVTCITAIAWPFYAFAALYADEIIFLLFGPQWGDAAAIVPWFCLAGAAAACSNLAFTLVIAQGGIEHTTPAECVMQITRAVALVAVVLIFRDIETFAITFAVFFICINPYIYRVKERCLPTDFKNLSKGLRASLLLCLAAMALPAAIRIAAQGHAPLSGTAAMILAALACAASWLVALVVLKHPLGQEPAFVALMKRILPEKFHCHF